MMRSRIRSNQQFEFGQLEPRNLLAGNVFVNWTDGQNLTVIGNSGDNEVAIYLNASTPEALVRGQNGTQVRFADSFNSGFDSADINNVFVFLNAGDDTVSIDGRSLHARGELVVSLGDGNDSLNMTGGVFAGNATVYAGIDRDSVFFDQTRFTSNVSLIAGSGMDSVGLNKVRVDGITRFFGQFGDDTMLVNDSTFDDSVFVEMGDGTDRFETVESTYDNRFSVRGRIGTDTSMLESTNSFAFNPNSQTIEVVRLSPNQAGEADEAIDQISAPFLATGTEVRTFTSDKMQDGMTEFTQAYNKQLFSLELDPVLQVITINDPTPTISTIWDQAVQDAVAASAVGPTISSRAYAMMHTAIFDAWSAYDDVAISTTLADQLQRPQSENLENNKRAAMSFAAYRVLEDLFASQSSTFTAIMEDLGFDPTNESTDVTTPAGIGNRMAAELLAFRHQDGANQLGTDPQGTQGVPYSDISGYQPVNPTGDAIDIEKWSPEFVPIDPAPGTTPRVQQFLTPHWGDVVPFSLTSGDQLRPVAPQPFLLVDGEVDLEARTVTVSGTELPINKGLIGTIINPEFIAQAQEVVDFSANLSDTDKLIAEFWEDGEGTSFPPGTTMTFGHFISARDNNTTGEDAKMFFMLGNAMLDASISTWEAKEFYDYTRPVRLIRELGELGLIGEFDASLGGFAIDAWSPFGGTQTILASEFLSYQTPGSDPSPPFAEYTSGHSAFSTAGARVLELYTQDTVFGASVSFAPGTSRFEPGLTPVSEVTLSWDTFKDAGDESGISRLFGGIHFTEGDLNGRQIGNSVGDLVHARALHFINGG